MKNEAEGVRALGFSYALGVILPRHAASRKVSLVSLIKTARKVDTSCEVPSKHPVLYGAAVNWVEWVTNFATERLALRADAPISTTNPRGNGDRPAAGRERRRCAVCTSCETC